jgi:hypothetical protein
MARDTPWGRLRRARVLSGLGLCGLMLPVSGYALGLYAQLPPTIHPSERYVIFSHGRIAEGNDPRPVSPEFGVYDFPALSASLFADSNFNLIAPQRPKSDDDAYADTLVAWVRALLAAGVPAGRITLVGFSRGSYLTLIASARLADAGINTAVMAICQNGDVENDPPLKLGGNLLSIYESSDAYGSCANLARRSPLKSFKEVTVSTGLKHGVFFEPRAVWMKPLKEWIAAVSVGSLPSTHP